MFSTDVNVQRSTSNAFNVDSRHVRHGSEPIVVYNPVSMDVTASAEQLADSSKYKKSFSSSLKLHKSGSVSTPSTPQRVYDSFPLCLFWFVFLVSVF